MSGLAVPVAPPNIARLLASIGQYAYAESDEGVWVNLYIGGTADATVAGDVSGESNSGNGLPVVGRCQDNGGSGNACNIWIKFTNSSVV